MSATQSIFAPLVASTRKPVGLDLQRLWLTGQVLAAGGRLVVQHIFKSAEKRPLEVIYAFPLPRDAALRGFRITGKGFEAHSELRQVEEAVKAYEQGIAAGSLASLARGYGDGLVNLTVGNILPGETVTVHLEILAGVELRDDGFRFRFPFTLAPAYHARMRVSKDGEQGEMELPSSEFGDVILPPFHRDASDLHEIGFDLRLPAAEICSPSHAIRVSRDAAGPARIQLAPAKDLPDRDLVLDAQYAEAGVQQLAGPSGDGKRSFAAVVPSTAFGRAETAARRVAILLDRSGSMQGEPIAQARKAVEACLAALGAEDQFGLLAFSDRVDSLHPELAPASREEREQARAFLNGVRPGGGTELARGIEHAARVLGGAGDLVVITDGQVFGTETILAQARDAGIRICCLGIGSASQDRFLALLARETLGVSRFVTPRERVDLAAVDLFASIGCPVAVDLQAPAAQPRPPHAIFAGVPLLLFGELADERENRVELTWDGGRMDLEVPPGDAATGELVRLLRGARLIADWESRYPAEEATAPLEKRQQSRVAQRLVELSRTYRLASREMSLVAVVKRAGDRPGELPETRVVPVGMPQDTKFDAYFSRAMAQFAFCGSPAMVRATADLSAGMPDGADLLPAGAPGRADLPGMVAPAAPPDTAGASGDTGTRLKFAVRKLRSFARRADTTAGAPGDPGLVELAALLEPDGGMPGATPDVRAARTAAALLAFASHGHTLHGGAFRLHVRRLAEFLKLHRPASGEEQRLADIALAAARGGNCPPGNWLAPANGAATDWQQLAGLTRDVPKFLT